MEIVELNRNDRTSVEAVATLYCTVFAERPWSEDWTIEAALEVVHKRGLKWFALRTDGQIIGFTAGVVGPASEIAADFTVPSELLTGTRIGYLAEVGINPQYRRSGLARELSNTLLTHFRAAAVDQFVVRTRPGTGNFGWYGRLLSVLHTYPDGRVIFGCQGVPTL